MAPPQEAAHRAAQRLAVVPGAAEDAAACWILGGRLSLGHDRRGAAAAAGATWLLRLRQAALADDGLPPGLEHLSQGASQDGTELRPEADEALVRWVRHPDEPDQLHCQGRHQSACRPMEGCRNWLHNWDSSNARLVLAFWVLHAYNP